MEGGIDASAVLDYVAFHILSAQNRYDAHACIKGRTEKIISGPLRQLALHLPKVKGFQSEGLSDVVKLQLNEILRGSSWFTKLTVTRFLQIMNAPEVLRNANAIGNEISQLEETRNFHLALHTKDHQDQSGGVATENSFIKTSGVIQKIKVETSSSNTAFNELLRAMDMRLMALREELVATFNQAAGATCSDKQFSDIAEFSQHFGAIDLRNSFYKCLALNSEEQYHNPSNDQSTSLHESQTCNGTEATFVLGSHVDVAKTATNGISPVKIAQAERMSSSEGEDSGDSGEDEATAERRRSVIRSASPRRSASPMRRIQIGRCGSRRSTSLTIKSLNFPTRERTYDRDTDGNNSGDEASDQPPKKPDSTVSRMSVQDAINLFESKKRDHKLDLPKTKASAELPVSTNKSVLRRWSAGLGDSSIQCSQENSYDGEFQSTPTNLGHLVEEKNLFEVKPSFDALVDDSKLPENTVVGASSELEQKSSARVDSPVTLMVPKIEEPRDRATESAEWTRQKEAELNQMMIKMLESKPGHPHRSETAGIAGNQELSSEQRGDLNSQYNEKRDEKLRAVTAGKQAEKQGKFKVMEETCGRRKAEMASKVAFETGKLDSLSNSQKPRRNLSPVLTKNESPKSVGSMKVPPKTSSPLPPTRSSWPSAPSPKMSGTSKSKTSPGIISSSTMPTRRKSQPTPSPTQPGSRTGRPLQQPKGTTGVQTESKSKFKGQEEKQQKAMTKTSKIAKPKTATASQDDTGAMPTKARLYNKVTKKSSVVPLESKPFLKKGTGSGVSPVFLTKVSQSDDSPKNSGNLIQAEEKEYVAATAETITGPLEEYLDPLTNDVDGHSVGPLKDDLNFEKTEILEPVVIQAENSVTGSVESPVMEIQPDEDLGIPSAAWVEIDNGLPQYAPMSLTGPRVRHSLSQMMQAESEAENVEWGNAENPPSMVHQKDAPKGLKRLLKFARKSKGEANATGSASPSVFSEGEEDADDPKATNKRNNDVLLRKSYLQTTGFGQQKTIFCESNDGGNSGERSLEHSTAQEILPVRLNTNNFPVLASYKVRECQISAAAPATKAARSFFSLSTFRSSK